MKQDEDSDLIDLLGKNTADQSHHATETMNLDHLTTSGIRVKSPNHHHNNNNNKKNTTYQHSAPMSCCDFVISYTIMLCQYYPKCCAGCTTTFVVVLGLLLSNLLFTRTPPVLDEHAVLQIHSKYDLTINQVDHWCLKGGNEHCRCEDPLQPTGRTEHASWVQAVKANQIMVKNATSAVDLVILGESVVEAMGGRWMGKSRSLKAIGALFQKTFQQKAVALGVAGDTAPNVLWRLLHGELAVRPKIWWISLGMNDLARMGCSEEIVVLGILRVVEEIMEQQPAAHIVINSVLPMVNVRGGAYPLVTDYEDALHSRQLLQEEAFLPDKMNRHLDSQRKKKVDATAEEIKDPKQLAKLRAQQAEQEEEQRAKTKKKRWRKNRREPVNAKLDARKYTLFHQIPLWTSIQVINQQLRRFTEEQPAQVHFFDATPLFVLEKNGKSRIRSDRITLKGYPRLAGFAAWEEAILAFAQPILDELKPPDNNKDNPEDDDDDDDDEDDLIPMEDDSV
ncbi:hypothetical protein FisN_15Lh279 [Fistulifera solaris]|uniref:SGNH hydrolase-type esterase domain-containing protein n=1 Tax=Fistulifera solaris TaxID=1519565 RepID=A0A1Z5K2E7_FISSO|nr:hypothetical protein FisN_15Lh279 [Fistulifera solaris]|eukprot:GAX20241.1 hypothetical protein FisN_15Lh279 [Fistulifera solaris]